MNMTHKKNTTDLEDIENMLWELFLKLKEKGRTDKQALMIIFRLGKK